MGWIPDVRPVRCAHIKQDLFLLSQKMEGEYNFWIYRTEPDSGEVVAECARAEADPHR